MFKKVMVGALTVAIVATGASMAVAGNGDDDSGDDGDVIRLIARTVSEGEVDTPPTGFGPGDRLFFSEDLYRDDERVGINGGECVIVRVQSETTATANCVATLSLPGGQITVQGLITFTEGDPPFTVAVTGGTGRYRDADGEMRIETVSAEEDRFTIHLD
jgi:hypothetical protein